jgi:hypothetical protein
MLNVKLPSAPPEIATGAELVTRSGPKPLYVPVSNSTMCEPAPIMFRATPPT